MSKVAQTESLPINGTVFDSSLVFALQTMVVETAIVATKSFAWSLMMMGTLPNGIDVFIKEPEAYAGLVASIVLPNSFLFFFCGMGKIGQFSFATSCSE
ncbi:hypothetical protein E1A91_A13G212300v1 [Gossypium mustelinum]|uniref:Uncharacterized protein n=1 Tax=Gossypium mustelinum TaxID=34275 RepID=A0A5D2WKI9_GOSMU|nr:hypothetical protein E1A91_A13G212300v1 [Gossypium mustelinum]